ncbi:MULTISPECIES: DUF3203 family protein [unclassified Pseudomonas]|uniref:DUF3203 family protein n=1 Tax=unclassified Pseudomonas TaxID=196821 RepID=UPI00119B8830|nr:MULTISPECIES: DUF3203 family protein [unclassified Pseudomonas]TWC21015.1 uncharacterized protein DUF3203 [Pseudomonas sp. SJZ075]TWC23585.1 uncharacterized protein DUF3203 [Pseudomonas sp. SJZ074]TWC36495.1 uncharacterized protein DUF3203 [Pseudomonas sp. SJZ078]TWC40468.1 uncharacterized protein DUF3203 [Pseudomonas sp. SJZ085]TWC57254.1 uncharacterized protein DUF3203 [Pseudomonas sp. SJZ124]
MTLRIDDHRICYFDTRNGPQQRPASELTIITDADKAMSAVKLNGDLVHFTEAEADALIQAGATDGRRHLKASDSGSAI